MATSTSQICIFNSEKQWFCTLCTWASRFTLYGRTYWPAVSVKQWFAAGAPICRLRKNWFWPLSFKDYLFLHFVAVLFLLATFRLEYEDEYEFKVLSTRTLKNFRPSSLKRMLSMVNSYSWSSSYSILKVATDDVNVVVWTTSSLDCKFSVLCS